MNGQTISYAYFRHRMLAQILDFFLVFALLAPCLYLLNTLILPLIDSTSALITYRLLRLILVLSFVAYGSAWCLVHYGATPGKMLLGLKVINLQTNQFPDQRQAMIRPFLTVLSIFSGIGVLLILIDKNKQAAHDKILHTVVLQRDDDYACESMPADWEQHL